MALENERVDIVATEGHTLTDLSAAYNLEHNYKIKIDEVLPESATTALEVGVADTSKLRFLMIKNKGTTDMVAMDVDGGPADIPLNAGDSVVLAGVGIAEKVVEEWNGGAGSIYNLNITTDGEVKVEVLAIVNL